MSVRTITLLPENDSTNGWAALFLIAPTLRRNSANCIVRSGCRT